MRRILLALTVLLALAVHAAARAGGGQSYSGSSYSSSGSGYSGSSSYSYGSSSGAEDILVGLALRFIFRHPGISIPLILFILYMTRSLWMEMNTSPVYSMGGGSVRGRFAGDKNEQLARLAARDPGFDERAFLARAGAAFLKIQEAWSAGDMAPARAFISDGVHERFGRQLSGLKARGLRNLMENVQVREAEVLACRSDKHFDALWVRIAASASDRTVDAGGSTVSSASSAFEEVWTFLRRPGAKTLKRPGLIEGHCPSCGSPLDIADAAQCGACKAWVNSGEYDWVLTEITQSCEWTLLDPARDVPGWEAVSEADPALNLPALEDRVSVIFWRWLDARRSADAGPLRPVADEAFCGAFKGAPAAFDDAAVGAVEVKAFEEVDGWTRVHVEVKWSGSGEARRNFFILSRAHGAKTDARQGLRTARCASCGAPPAEGSAAACGYCGAALNDGKKDWVLTRIVPFGEWRAPSSTASGRGTSAPYGAVVPSASWGGEMSAADAYAVLASAMLADGEETLAEKSFLEAYAKARALPPEKAAAISAAARAGKLDAPKAADGAQAKEMLRGMIRMSLADGLVSDAERAALHSFGARYSLRPYDIAAMVLEERDGPRKG